MKPSRDHLILKYDTDPHRMVCLNCGGVHEVNFEGKTLNEVGWIMEGFMKDHEDCKIGETQ